MLWHHIIYGDSHFSSRTSSLLSVCASFVVRHSPLSTAARCTEHNFCRVACYCRRRRLLFEPNKQDTTTTRKKKYRGIIHALRMIINKFRNLVFTHTRHTHAAPYAWHPLNLELFRSRVLNVSRGSQCWPDRQPPDFRGRDTDVRYYFGIFMVAAAGEQQSRRQ